MSCWQVIAGDARAELEKLAANSVQACVTSPPYWQKRDYGCDGQIGTELSPEGFAESLLATFGEVRRVLVPSGSLWLNLGDSYAAGGNGGGGSLRQRRQNWRSIVGRRGWRKAAPGFKSKDLTLVPFMAAAALRDSGWYLRQVVVWWRLVANEPNRLDRPAVSHEYLFLFSKSEDSSVRDPGESWWSQSVWSIPASSGAGGHPAPMPTELARRCIVAGSKPSDTVIDPFCGSGTTGIEAVRQQRHFIGIELNPAHVQLSRARIGAVYPLFSHEATA